MLAGVFDLVEVRHSNYRSLRGWWETTNDWEREMACRTWPELERFQPPPKEWSFEVHEALLRAAMNAQSATCLVTLDVSLRLSAADSRAHAAAWRRR